MSELAATLAKKPAMPETREYIVFGVTSDGPQVPPSFTAWTEVGRATGKTNEEARDKIIDKLPADEQGGPFVTIAARYWQPETFILETTTVRKAKG